MKKINRICALVLMLSLLTTSAFAADSKTTPTPAPVQITAEVQTPPAEIQQVLDIAYHEWDTLAGKTLKKCNKYTEWRGKGVSFGWCGGFVTWCMMEAGIPTTKLETLKQQGDYEVEGIMHVEEASVGKLLRGYQIRNRSTNIPQPGFLLVYGESYNKTIHIGLVYDVVALGEGRYRITTIEGNMSNRVKMYVHDYDSQAANKQKNLTVVPKGERNVEETRQFSYQKQGDKWYVNCFLMPWIPDGMDGQRAAAEETVLQPNALETNIPEV